ncbi:hypothetical protein WN943_014063 [Citrus x changshan-huyou]
MSLKACLVASALSQFAHLGCCTSSLASLPLHLISVIAASSPTLLVRHLAATTVALSNYLDYFCSLSSIFVMDRFHCHGHEGEEIETKQPEKPKEEPKNEEPKKKEESKKEEPKKEPKKEEEKKEEEKKQEAAPAPVPPSDPILELVKAYRAYSANCARYTFILQKLSQYPKISNKHSSAAIPSPASPLQFPYRHHFYRNKHSFSIHGKSNFNTSKLNLRREAATTKKVKHSSSLHNCRKELIIYCKIVRM